MADIACWNAGSDNLRAFGEVAVLPAAASRLCDLRAVLVLADAGGDHVRNATTSFTSEEIWRRTGLETPVAAFDAIRLPGLIDRIFNRRAEIQQAQFDILRKQHSVFQRLASYESDNPDWSDDDWLKREELRGPVDVTGRLAESAFPDAIGSLWAMLVDKRCGLIATHIIGKLESANVGQTPAEILRLASRYHADGVILASNDPDGELAKGRNCHDLTFALYEKGRAIDIHLLDHFVLTRDGWKRMMAVRAEDRL